MRLQSANQLESSPRAANLIIQALRNTTAITPGSNENANIEPQPIRVPGSVIVYDPTGAPYQVHVQIQFPNTSRWITLFPGKAFDLRPRGFREFRVRFIKAMGAVTTVPINTYLGQLIIGTDLDVTLLGANSATAVYQRDLPSVLVFNTTVLTAIGALGIFSHRATLPGTLDGQCVRIDYRITNVGTGDLYIGAGSAIIVNDASSRSQVMKLYNGSTIELTRAGRPANPFATTPSPTDDDVFLYSEDVGGAFEAMRREYYIS